MTFKDIFKSNFLESVTEFSVTDTVIALVCALVIGLFIFLIYKKTCSGIMYSDNFALTLIGLTLVTTLVIMAVTSNVVLSLGMVGALSIVRFRAAIKEPIEIVYLFWSIAAGIVLGAGLIPLAFIGSALIGLILFIMASRKTHTNPYMLILHLDNEESENKVMAILRESTDKMAVKAKTVTKSGIEISAEVRLKDASTSFVSRICSQSGVNNASLVNFNGEYMS